MMSNRLLYDPVYDALRPVNELLEDVFSSVESLSLLNPLMPTMQGDAFATMGNLPLDMYETDKALVIKAMLPGFTEDEIEILEQNNILTIRAEHKEEREESGESWIMRERSAQAFERTVSLPVEVKSGKAEAVLENGVLRITLPKVTPGKSIKNRIKVTAPKLSLPKFGKKEGKVKVKKS